MQKTFNYQHSDVFASLKRTNESLKDNLTTAQYLHTLDYFIWNAITPIIKVCPSFFYNYLCKALVLQTINPNNKYTSGEKDKLPSLLFNVLTEPNVDKRIEILKSMYINRGLLLALLSIFSRTTKSYLDLGSGLMRIHPIKTRSLMLAIELKLGVTDSKQMYNTIRTVSYWSEKARSFKSMIVEKYTRMALMQAKKTYEDYSYKVPLDDVVQTYLVIVNKAIDRCDPRLGVLTTFISNWLKSAKTIVANEANHSMSESLDQLIDDMGDSSELGSVTQTYDFERMQHVSYLARQVDTSGLVTFHLGIPEFVTRTDRQILIKHRTNRNAN